MRKLVIFGILMLMLAPLVSADTNLGTIQYLDTRMIPIDGNVTLSFHYTPTGTEDVVLILRLYDPDLNKTVYGFQSLVVGYDSSFVNDTKTYTFKDGNESYNISVDYSSIQVPPSLDEIIAGYEARIEELIANNTLLLEKIELLYLALNGSYDQINATLLELEMEKAKNKPLVDQIINYTSELERSEWAYRQMQIELNEYKDPWLFFSRDGIFINFATLVLTALILATIFVVYTSRANNKPIPGWEQIKTVIFKQKPKKFQKIEEGSPKDLEFLKKGDKKK